MDKRKIRSSATPRHRKNSNFDLSFGKTNKIRPSATSPPLPSLQKPDRQEQSPCRCILRKPKYTLTMHVELRNIAQSTSGVSDIKKCMGILKSINVVNLPASINAMFELKIDVNLPQLLCVVVSAAQNSEF